MNERRFPINRNALLIKIEYEYKRTRFCCLCQCSSRYDRNAFNRASSRFRRSHTRIMIAIARNKWNNMLGCTRLTAKILARKIISCSGPEQIIHFANEFDLLPVLGISHYLPLSYAGLLSLLIMFLVRHATCVISLFDPGNQKLYCIVRIIIARYNIISSLIYTCRVLMHDKTTSSQTILL
jgi:hypothetical protein